MRKLISQFTKFGVIGALGFVIDTGIFNILIFTVLASDIVAHGSIYAKIISTVVAIVVNWIGNRFWTFRAHRGPQLWREGLEFGLVSLGGLVIGIGILWISHYAMGFRNPVADNIANLVGLGVGTVFRFTFYRIWVFRPHKGEPEPLFDEDEEPVLDAPVVAPASDVSAAPTRSSRPGAATAPAGAARQSD